MEPFEGLIDIHCHTAGIGAGGSGCFVSRRLRRSFRYRFYLKAFGVTEQELLAEGDGLIIQRISRSLARSQRVSAAVILAMDGMVDNNGELDETGTEIYIPNEFVAGARSAATPTSCSGQASTRFVVTPSGAWKRPQVTVQCC